MGGKRAGRGLCFLAFLTLLVPAAAWAGVPVVSNVYVTDVTTKSFSVIWTASEASTPGIAVYTNAAGTVPAAGITITASPTLCNASLATTAQSLGVMKVRVTGLAPNTLYYFQTRTTSTSTSSLTLYPATGAALLQVTTAVQTVRANATNIPIGNDVILSNWTMADGTTAATGTIVFASVTNGDYPLSAYVGDCAPAGSALIDLNNMFDRTSGQSLDLSQGITLNLVNFRGTNGTSQIVHEVPAELVFAGGTAVAIKPPAPGLRAGWNMVSIQYQPDTATTTSVLSTVISNISSIWTYNSATAKWLFYDKNGLPMLNTLTTIDNNVGYWLNVATPSSWLIKGHIDTTPKALKTGWNLIGFDYLESAAIADATATISTAFKSIWTFDIRTNKWKFFDKTGLPMLNTLSAVEPGKAYWINVTQDCTL